ncbi:M24 family metallopeptidase, partial [Mesorhizobium sp. M1E.F.Ca.ET.063.01.1.1]
VYMREAGRLITKVMNEAIEMTKSGVPENEIIAEVYRSQIRGIEGKHGDYSSACPLIQVGEGTSTPHLTWTSTPLPDNGLVVMELAGVRRHYHAPLSRTISIGTPSNAAKKLADAIIEGGDAALAAAKSGVITEEVEAVWQNVLRKHGYRKESRVGYSIGLNYPPDWGEKTVSLRKGEKTVLQHGMCFHFQSGVWLEDFGIAISESFVVTDKGGERLADVDRRLFTVR